MLNLKSVGAAYSASKMGSSKRAAIAATPGLNPFGPAMADNVFNFSDERYYEECDEMPYHSLPQDINPEDMYDGETQSFHFCNQGNLDLETNEQREVRLKQAIRRFESGYQKMCMFALKWAYLMEEVEEDDQIKKMFNDMQMIRKLRGSNLV